MPILLGGYKRFSLELAQSYLGDPVADIGIERRLNWRKLRCRPLDMGFYDPSARIIHVGISDVEDCVKSSCDKFERVCQRFPHIRNMSRGAQNRWFLAFVLYHEIGHAIQHGHGDLEESLQRREQEHQQLVQNGEELLGRVRAGVPVSLLEVIDFRTRQLESEFRDDPEDAEIEERATAFALRKLREAQQQGLLP